MSKLTRLNYIIILTITLIMPFYLYYYYNGTSEKTYQRDYILIKEGDYDYFERFTLANSPIINENSIREFINHSIVNIFNYRTNVAIRNLDDYEQYFSSAAFNSFKRNFQLRISEEIDRGVVINGSVLERKPMYIGSYRSQNGFESRLYFMDLRELKIGEVGTRTYASFRVFVEIQFEDFSVNGKGLSIRAIEVR